MLKQRRGAAAGEDTGFAYVKGRRVLAALGNRHACQSV